VNESQFPEEFSLTGARGSTSGFPGWLTTELLSIAQQHTVQAHAGLHWTQQERTSGAAATAAAAVAVQALAMGMNESARLGEHHNCLSKVLKPFMSNNLIHVEAKQSSPERLIP